MKSELPAVGTRLHAFRRRPSDARVEAVIVADQAVRSGRAVEVQGLHYETLSAAATAITGSRRNGWMWFHTEDGRPAGEDRGKQD